MQHSLYGTAYMFSKEFFTGWVIVSLLWAFFAFIAVTVFPIIEGRRLLFSWFKDLFEKKHTQSHEDRVHRHDAKQEDGESSGPASSEAI